MARFNSELPNDLLKEFEQLNANSEEMMGEMTHKSAEYVKGEIERRAKTVFKDSNRILKHLIITKVYKTPSDDGINTKVGFSRLYVYKRWKIF